MDTRTSAHNGGEDGLWEFTPLSRKLMESSTDLTMTSRPQTSPQEPSEASTPFLHSGRNAGPVQPLSHPPQVFDMGDDVNRGVVIPMAPAFPFRMDNPSRTVPKKKVSEDHFSSPDGLHKEEVKLDQLKPFLRSIDTKSTRALDDFEPFSDMYLPPVEPESVLFVFSRTTLFFVDSPASTANLLANCLYMPNRGWEVHTVPEKFSLTAVCNTSPEPVTVEVLFFRSSFEGTKATAMELRRLEGDALAFSRLFCGLKEQVRKAGVLLGSQGKGKGGRVDERGNVNVSAMDTAWDGLLDMPSRDPLSPPIPVL
uniref:Uncharacterized protein n=1 Tax=Chromera velia CCMP2878 TaxID=1169474 RepID=A0A0G4IF78_9ALVE|eukprot:Cvel_13969.t1-p1 / transcript=Cvel_13969.t1 / gene=Cvel_13969 / organism=Chromera_velia_CCMP2878 / gene_product=hypothetical protein / transcript_product=hypothetical protein / location=Cvel_scaffold976:19505-22655(+) / protein_length=310 / sequence_SO=supercontig / SO=protein_coding / is_pseudo=false